MPKLCDGVTHRCVAVAIQKRVQPVFSDLKRRRLRLHVADTLVGDADQLPSVGPGDFFRAVCAASGVTVSRLDEVFRNITAAEAA